ncbi:hypothetical protein HYH02_001075 [Chlamydomonas schloesseri]|uniref:GATA-type domain-containing protein n=1 Tax=Chlamydomonas schloesseri TaxID=2026947 RepID=A0A835WTP9_9CHLO|nr:hypothetical protein HYH02_001075 [Chlamydomonas schloesseri]|eukprot:KAG2454034.1 hypothetical protein HYH02_001075 [Chlamydomonas schloesseri]
MGDEQADSSRRSKRQVSATAGPQPTVAETETAGAATGPTAGVQSESTQDITCATCGNACAKDSPNARNGFFARGTGAYTCDSCCMSNRYSECGFYGPPGTRSLAEAGGRECGECGTEHTPQWRLHPFRTGAYACTACGLKLERQQQQAAAAQAEQPPTFLQQDATGAAVNDTPANDAAPPAAGTAAAALEVARMPSLHAALPLVDAVGSPMEAATAAAAAGGGGGGGSNVLLVRRQRLVGSGNARSAAEAVAEESHASAKAAAGAGAADPTQSLPAGLQAPRQQPQLPADAAHAAMAAVIPGADGRAPHAAPEALNELELREPGPAREAGAGPLTLAQTQAQGDAPGMPLPACGRTDDGSAQHQHQHQHQEQQPRSGQSMCSGEPPTAVKLTCAACSSPYKAQPGVPAGFFTRGTHAYTCHGCCLRNMANFGFYGPPGTRSFEEAGGRECCECGTTETTQWRLHTTRLGAYCCTVCFRSMLTARIPRPRGPAAPTLAGPPGRDVPPLPPRPPAQPPSQRQHTPSRRRPRRVAAAAAGLQCAECGAVTTPQWRKHPMLQGAHCCNACGLKLRKRGSLCVGPSRSGIGVDSQQKQQQQQHQKQQQQQRQQQQLLRFQLGLEHIRLAAGAAAAGASQASAAASPGGHAQGPGTPPQPPAPLLIPGGSGAAKVQHGPSQCGHSGLQQAGLPQATHMLLPPSTPAAAAASAQLPAAALGAATEQQLPEQHIMPAQQQRQQVTCASCCATALLLAGAPSGFFARGTGAFTCRSCCLRNKASVYGFYGPPGTRSLQEAGGRECEKCGTEDVPHWCSHPTRVGAYVCRPCSLALQT